MLPPGYTLRRGGWGDRSLLRQFLQLTYQELFPNLQNFAPLGETVERMFSNATPLWWVETLTAAVPEELVIRELSIKEANPQKSNPGTSIACLWLGTALDQSLGERYSQIFLLYVAPEHRRLGLGKALIQQAETWAKSRGDRQIGLQVFVNNQKAVNLYQDLGYETQSLLMIKYLT